MAKPKNNNEKTKIRQRPAPTPKQLANLRPVQKGEIRNPKGKPKGTRDRATIVQEVMNTLIQVADPSNPQLRKKVTLYEAAMMGQFKSAINGNTAAWKEIQDTLHGKQTEKQEITGAEGQPLFSEMAEVLDRVYGKSKS